MGTIKIPFHLDVRSPKPGDLEQARAIFREEMEKAVKDCAMHVRERVKQVIEREDIINEGHLINSIAYAMAAKGTVLEGHVGTNLYYAKYQEFGTVPHFVPFHLAKSLYNQAIGDWGWIPVDKATRARLNAAPDSNVWSVGGLRIVTGRHQSYLNPDDKLWAKPYPNAKPVWGIVVSGRKQPFLYPGWIESINFITYRLQEGGRRAAQRINGGE